VKAWRLVFQWGMGESTLGNIEPFGSHHISFFGIAVQNMLPNVQTSDDRAHVLAMNFGWKAFVLTLYRLQSLV